MDDDPTPWDERQRLRLLAASDQTGAAIRDAVERAAAEVADRVIAIIRKSLEERLDDLFRRERGEGNANG
jgi:hypothetical protein